MDYTDYLIFGAVAIGLALVFWGLGRLISRTSRNEGAGHGNPQDRLPG